jgi:hypothetical protein
MKASDKPEPTPETVSNFACDEWGNWIGPREVYRGPDAVFAPQWSVSKHMYECECERLGKPKPTCAADYPAHGWLTEDEMREDPDDFSARYEAEIAELKKHREAEEAHARAQGRDPRIRFQSANASDETAQDETNSADPNPGLDLHATACPERACVSERAERADSQRSPEERGAGTAPTTTCRASSPRKARLGKRVGLQPRVPQAQEPRGFSPGTLQTLHAADALRPATCSERRPEHVTLEVSVASRRAALSESARSAEPNGPNAERPTLPCTQYPVLLSSLSTPPKPTFQTPKNLSPRKKTQFRPQTAAKSKGSSPKPLPVLSFDQALTRYFASGDRGQRSAP